VESARRFWSVAAGLALGAVVGVLVSYLGSGAHKAEASVLISSPAGGSAVRPMLPNLRELAVSGVVAGNVRSTLRLTEPTEQLRRHLDATVRPNTEVIAVTATDASADRARQFAQETATVFAQLVDRRFGTGKPELHGAVLDSAHSLGGPDRNVLRNGLAGALIGLLLGAAAMFVLASRARQPGVVFSADDSELRYREQMLEQRVQSVTSRERALAARVGSIAGRERELEARLAHLAAREEEPEAAPVLPEPVAPAPEPEPEPAPAPEPEPEPAPEPAAAPAPATAAAAWNLNDLERAAQARTDVSPEQADEWRTYLFLLRQHATQDGALPRSFEPLIREVFAELLHFRPPD